MSQNASTFLPITAPQTEEEIALREDWKALLAKWKSEKILIPKISSKTLNTFQKFSQEFFGEKLSKAQLLSLITEHYYFKFSLGLLAETYSLSSIPLANTIEGILKAEPSFSLPKESQIFVQKYGPFENHSGLSFPEIEGLCSDLQQVIYDDDSGSFLYLSVYLARFAHKFPIASMKTALIGTPLLSDFFYFSQREQWFWNFQRLSSYYGAYLYAKQERKALSLSWGNIWDIPKVQGNTWQNALFQKQEDYLVQWHQQRELTYDLVIRGSTKKPSTSFNILGGQYLGKDGFYIGSIPKPIPKASEKQVLLEKDFQVIHQEETLGAYSIGLLKKSKASSKKSLYSEEKPKLSPSHERKPRIQRNYSIFKFYASPLNYQKRPVFWNSDLDALESSLKKHFYSHSSLQNQSPSLFALEKDLEDPDSFSIQTVWKKPFEKVYIYFNASAWKAPEWAKFYRAHQENIYLLISQNPLYPPFLLNHPPDRTFMPSAKVYPLYYYDERGNRQVNLRDELLQDFQAHYEEKWASEAFELEKAYRDISQLDWLEECQVEPELAAEIREYLLFLQKDESAQALESLAHQPTPSHEKFLKGFKSTLQSLSRRFERVGKKNCRNQESYRRLSEYFQQAQIAYEVLKTHWQVRAYEDFERSDQLQKEDIFYYLLGLLHTQESKELELFSSKITIPLRSDFWQWVDWGKQIKELFLSKEAPLLHKIKPKLFTVRKASRKFRYSLDPLSGTLRLEDRNTALEIKGVSPQTQEWKLGKRSPLEHVLAQYPKFKGNEEDSFLTLHSKEISQEIQKILNWTIRLQRLIKIISFTSED